MKFSINYLLSKYNLVLILSILFVSLIVYIALNSNSYKEYMDDTQLNDIPVDYSQIQVCSLLDENNCSKNKYCKWNSYKNICNKLNICQLLDSNRCNNSNNIIWDNVKNECIFK